MDIYIHILEGLFAQNDLYIHIVEGLLAQNDYTDHSFKVCPLVLQIA